MENREKVFLDFFMFDERYSAHSNDRVPEAFRSIAVDAIDLTRSLVCLGKMGSGKTKFFESILLQDWAYNRAIIHDLKGEYVEKFYNDERDIIFNPYDSRGQIWDMFADMRRNPALIAKVARGMVFAVNTAGDFWTTAPANVLSKIFSKAISGYRGSEYDVVRQEIEKYRQKALESDDKTALSISNTLEILNEIFKLLAHLQIVEGVKSFSIYEFLERKYKQKLFLLNSPAYYEAVSPLFSSFLSTLVALMLSRDDTKEDLTLILLDEFLSLKIEQSDAQALFTAVRSKGGQLLIGSQFLPVTGNDSWKSQLILSSKFALVLFPIADEKTIQIISNAVGEQEFIYVSTNRSTSVSKSPGMLMTQTTTSYSEGYNEQRQTAKFITSKLLSTIPKYHHITFLNDFIYLGYTPDWKLEKVDENFIQRDLSSYLASSVDLDDEEEETEEEIEEIEDEREVV